MTLVFSRVKKRLKGILKKNADFNEEDMAALNPTDDISVKAAIAEIKNPASACEEMYRSIGELTVLIREKARSQESERKCPRHRVELDRVSY